MAVSCGSLSDTMANRPALTRPQHELQQGFIYAHLKIF
jgi:hypothetical protein